jgi:hypothetical protein
MLMNDTVPLSGTGERAPVALSPRDRTSDLRRIVRHALMAGAATGPLDRAIRSAAGPLPAGSQDVDAHALRLARRIDSLLAQPVDMGDPHRETIHD